MENINATDLLNYLTRIERLLEEKKQIKALEIFTILV